MAVAGSFHRFSLLAGCVVSLGIAGDATAAGARLFKSGPIQITAHGAWVWVANQHNDSISRIETSTQTVTEYPLPDPAVRDSPRGLSLKEDGSEVWLACHDSDRIYVLSGTNGALLAQIDLPWGSGPYSVALSRTPPTVPSTQRFALVTLHRAAALAVLDVASRQVTHILKPVYWSPMGICWTQDGMSAWVTHLFAEGEHPFLTRVDFSGAEPKVKTRMTVFATDPRPSSRLAAPYNIAEGGYLTLRGHPAQIPMSGRSEVWLPIQYNNISEDVYTPDSTVQSTIRRLLLSTRTIPNGTNDKVILTAVHAHDTTGSNPYIGPGWNAHVSGPIDIGFSANGATTYLLHELSEDVVVLPSLTGMVKPANAPPLTEIPVGKQPKGLAVSPVGNMAYVYNLLSRDVSVIDLALTQEVARIAVTPLTGEPMAASVKRGAEIFHSSADPRISQNNKVSCASCHINAEHDGRSWAFHRLPGPHGPREVPSLLGLYRTMGPRDPATGLGQLHRSGDRDEVQDFEHTFQGVNMGGLGFLGTNVQAELGAPNAGLSADLDALSDYLLSLEPIMRSPYRAPDGSLNEAAIRGATFFKGTNRTIKVGDAGCAACHVPETGFVDFRFYDVGSRRPAEEEELNTRPPFWKVNTPTLVGVWTTPPYNGVANYAPSIIDVLKDQVSRANSATPHGKPNGLTRRQLADLAEFVGSIDGNMTAGEVRGARDISPPRIVRVEPASLTRVDVWFNESIKRGSVTNAAVWELSRIAGGTSFASPVSAAVWDAQNGDRVTLTTLLQPNAEYELRVAGTILDEADAASSGVANALDHTDPGNTRRFNIGSTLTITLGASGYENLTIPVHDVAMAGPNLATWGHDSVWLFPVGSGPRVNTGFVRFGWRNVVMQVCGVVSSSEILNASFSLHGETGDVQTIDIRRMLKNWSDPAAGGDYNTNPTGAPTWNSYSHPNLAWNQPGAGALGGTGASPADYNGVYDLSGRIDATATPAAINERVTFAGAPVTDAFRFWFDNPTLDYGYALRVRTGGSQEVKFERWESGLQEEGPVLTITYALPVSPVLSRPAVLGSNVEFQLNAQAGRRYQIQASSNLQNWSTATNVTLSNAVSNIVLPLAGEGQQFYRALTP
jgi:DNA-binding beta-propeller fold protein YncE